MVVDDLRRSYHRLRMQARRKFRRQKRQVEGITLQADSSIDKYFFKRFPRLKEVRRFVIAWLVLVIFIGLGAFWQVGSLDRYYLQLAPVSGGVYREGMIGTFTNANPLFATGSADVAVSKLVFNGLFRLSPDGKLEPDLATGFEVDEDGLNYTVHLKENVQWHDGEKFDANDVVYTYEKIKDPEVKSPLQASWNGVQIKVADEHTVIFTLPSSLSSFQYSLTNGIVPRHALEGFSSADLRSTSFNSVNPIGTGAFTYSSVEVLGNGVNDRRERVTLETNSNYFGKRPFIDGIQIRTYRNEDSMIDAFQHKEISSMVGLQTLPDYIASDETVQTFSTPLSSQVLVFFNNATEQLTDAKVRRALLQATDVKQLREAIGYQLTASDGPFLKSHFTYDSAKVQSGYDVAAAEKLLDEAGWTKDQNGQRQKDGKPLKLRLVSQSLTEYATVVQRLQQQWKAIGVNVDAVLQPEEDIQSGAVVRHDYDVLLYGISLGPDPDIFAYWHSSQADPRLKSRLNLSEYKSSVADKALEGGRTRSDENLRKVKYTPFLDAWLADTPAIALYQPRFLFVVRGTLEGYTSGEFYSPVDRFYSIANWQIRRDQVIK